LHQNLKQKTKTKMDSVFTSATSKTIRVVAPATLEEGYTFDVLLGDRPYTVTVPPGGVDEGEEFEIPYPDDEESNIGYLKSNGHKDDDDTLPCPTNSREDCEDYTKTSDTGTGAPFGRWRYHLLACCDVFTQATFWQALFCPPVLIAQLVTRMRLNWRGLPGDTDEEISLSYNKILLSFLGVLLVGILLPVGGLILAVVYALAVSVYVGGNVRRTLRGKYKIPAKLQPVEDHLCMLFCGCCSSIQMARHTHDDKEYPGYCCTQTGLQTNAPKIV
jgi:Cys-rich protein (TIGR01571 family)